MIRYGALSLAWIRQQGWEYKKHDDRPLPCARDAHKTLTRYEASALLKWAYEAGIERGVRESAEEILSTLCGLTPAQVETATALHGAVMALLGPQPEKAVDPPPPDQL